MLPLAPEPGLARWLASVERVDHLTVDLDSPLATMRADITRLPFDDGSFDLILCSHMLEHVPDDGAALGELSRVLRPHGTAIIQVPPSPLEETYEDPSATSPKSRKRAFGQYDHVRICGADYHGRLEDGPFQVAEMDYVERFDAPARAEYGLRTGEPFYLCTKPSSGE